MLNIYVTATDAHAPLAEATVLAADTALDTIRKGKTARISMSASPRIGVVSMSFEVATRSSSSVIARIRRVRSASKVSFIMGGSKSS